MSAHTQGRIARLVAEHGWHVLASSSTGAYFRRGTTSITLRYNAAGALTQAIRYRPGEAERVTKGKQTAVRQWLTQP